MLTRTIATIQEHQEIVGNRFQLSQIIMRRTKELIDGAPISKGLSAEFTPRRRGEIPNQSFAKVAMEELRTGKLHWKNVQREDIVTEIPLVIFGE